MQVTILMSLVVYDGFVDKCDQSSREYAILKNGLIIRRPKENHFERLMEIHCDMEEANKLLLLASKVYPEAIEDIAKAIAAASKSD
ncbi:MAG TPA: hypothetical protein VFQ43_13960 [Nitrososphaera sp.]|nr:hypothetical protein [Nitrososphaera sp.]